LAEATAGASHWQKIAEMNAETAREALRAQAAKGGTEG
jgi:hypothetical protein